MEVFMSRNIENHDSVLLLQDCIAGCKIDGAQPLKAGQAAEHLGHEGRDGDGLPQIGRAHV